MNEPWDWQQAFFAFAFSLPRMLVAFTLLPVFSRQSLPGLTRNSVAAALTLLVLPVNILDAPQVQPGWLQTLALTFKESLIGLLIGFVAAVPFWVAQSVGYFIDNQRGTTMASSIDPMTGSQTSPTGLMLGQTLAVLFFVGGGVLLFLGALYESYRVWPLFTFYPHLNQAAIVPLLGLVDHLGALIVLLSAPIIIVMFMSEFALGLISRFTPQMNVFSLAMPIKSAVGLFVLVLYIAILLEILHRELGVIGSDFSAIDSLVR